MKTNKKLIKQLKRCGFKKIYNYLMEFVHEGDVFFMNLSTDNFYCEYALDKYDMFSPTFAQIAAAIKEHTGEELKPKPTKAQRIEALEKRIEALEVKTKGLKQECFFGMDYGTSSGCIDALSYVMHGVGKPCKKDAETKPVFEVGDPVIIVRQVHQMHRSEIKKAINERKILVVRKVEGRSVYLDYLTGEPFIHKAVSWDINELQHPPKEAAKVLKFGDWAETLVGKPEITLGSRVLILTKLDDDGEFKCGIGNDDEYEYYRPEDLKAL